MELTYPLEAVEYRQIQRDINPAWQQDQTSQHWHECFGTLKDGITYNLKLGTEQKFCDFANVDGLQLQIFDRNLDEPYRETVTVTRTRIKNAWDIWFLAGTKKGLILSLNHAGYPNVEIIDGRTPPTGWTTPNGWWDFWVILKPPLPFDNSLWQAIIYDHNTPNVDLFYDTIGNYYVPDGPPDEILRVRNMIMKWKPSHANLVAILVYVTESVNPTILAWTT